MFFLQPYFDFQEDVFAAPVALDCEHLWEDHDDAVLRFSETAVEENVVHHSLENKRGEKKAF